MFMCTHGQNQMRVQTRQADKNKLTQKKQKKGQAGRKRRLESEGTSAIK